MRIGKLFRFVAIVLFLSISSCVFAQKVQIKIEGNGAVCVQDKLFSGEGLYEFEVEKGIDTLHFRIKPGVQYYLDSLLDCSSGNAIPVSRDNIYAERDDNLHYSKYSLSNVNAFHFVFREVQPWSRMPYPPYGSRDERYYLIYTPEELIHACYTDVFPKDSFIVQTISLQNDIDFDEKRIWAKRYDSTYTVLLGNNKTIKKYPDMVDLFARVVEASNLHILDGRLGFGNSVESILGCTANPIMDDNSEGAILGSVFMRGDCLPNLQDCINFGDCNRKPIVFLTTQNAKNLINWGSCIF